MEIYQLLAGSAAGTFGFAIFLHSKENREKTKNPLKTWIGFLILGAAFGALIPLPALVLLAVLLAASWSDLLNQEVANECSLGGGLVVLGTATLLAFIQKTPLYLPLLQGLYAAGGLLAIALLGKVFFGKKIMEFEPAVLLGVNKSEKRITLGPEDIEMDIFFQDGSGKANFYSPEGKKVLSLHNAEGKTSPEETPKEALVNRITLPRDVLGQADIKLMFSIGVICGPLGSAFALTAAAVLGVLLGIPLSKANGRIPLVPFLTFGTIFYLWKGEEILKSIGW